MEFLLYGAGSAAILLLVACMVYCCLAALGWLPSRFVLPFARHWELPSGSVTARETLFWAVAALVIQWAVLFFAHCQVTGGAAGFFPHLWERFTTAGDSPHYQFLAQYGYAADEEHLYLVAFYPLYPLLLRLLSPLFGGSYGLSGMVLSQLCFAGAAAVFRRYTARILPADGARAATFSFLLYPFSYFAFGVYTEGLFLLLVIGCLALLQQRRWVGAGALAFLAGLCRTQGVVLFFACLYAWLAAGRGGGPAGLKYRLRRDTPWAVLGAPAGFGLYLCVNWLIFGDFTRYISYQAAAPWYQSVHWYGDNLIQQWGMAVDYPGLARFIYLPQIFLYFLGIAALVWLLVSGVSHTAAVYSVAFLGMSYLSGWLISGCRYMFGCIGLYLALGALPNKWVRRALLLLQAGLLVLYAVYYMQGQAIM